MGLVSTQQYLRQGGIKWCKQDPQHQAEVVLQPGMEMFPFCILIQKNGGLEIP